MTAVDAGSVELAVTYETQQHGEPSLRSARGQPVRDTQHTRQPAPQIWFKNKGNPLELEAHLLD